LKKHAFLLLANPIFLIAGSTLKYIPDLILVINAIGTKSDRLKLKDIVFALTDTSINALDRTYWFSSYKDSLLVILQEKPALTPIILAKDGGLIDDIDDVHFQENVV